VINIFRGNSAGIFNYTREKTKFQGKNSRFSGKNEKFGR
jgi:hypothetical protein